MHELIYAGKNIEDILRKRFPSAKITDASDYIHHERFEFDCGIDEDEFYPFAIKSGFALNCFCFHIWVHDKEDYPKIDKWIKESQKEELCQDTQGK